MIQPLLIVSAVVVTVGIYLAAQTLSRRTGWLVLNPVLIAITVIIGVLTLSGISFEQYNRGAKWITLLLGPAVVALGVPLYEQRETIKRNMTAVLLSLLVGSICGILSVILLAALFQLPGQILVSLAPKSVTTPIAIGISEAQGGLPSLTAVVVIAVGIFGAVVGPGFLTLLGIRTPLARGLATGAAAHGIGTARILEEGRRQGAGAGLAIGINGILTALLTPVHLSIFSWLTGL